MRTLLIVCAMTALSGCDESPTAPTVRLDTEFVLAPNQSARVESAAIRFLGVRSDSRCPADVVCVRAGEAVVRIAVIARARAEYELSTGNSRPAQHDDLTIHLVQVAPYPFSTRPIAPDDYRVTLTVTRS